MSITFEDYRMADASTVQQVVDAYRKALLSVHGDEFEKATVIESNRGWIRINAANGHSGVYRKCQVVEMTRRLNDRK